MTNDDIIRMARKAELAYGPDEKPLESVICFAELVAEHERDQYAEKFAELIVSKICELLTEYRQFKAAVIVGQYFRSESND